MNIILLSGGSGTRLWPLSNEVRSKQFLKIFRTTDGSESMIQRMYRMIHGIDNNAQITIATSQDQVQQIKTQLGSNVGISIEPCRRDTFPAIVLACAYLVNNGVSKNEAVVVCPVDPYVEDGYFLCLKTMYDAASDDQNNITLMGIRPTCPSEKFGYILTDGSRVKGFREKPDEKTAARYIDDGALWNGGVFAFKLQYVLDKAEEIFGTSDYDELLKNYDKLNKISFDYAVVEKETQIGVIEYSGQWQDLGTWNTLTQVMTDAVRGKAVLVHSDNTHVINELDIPMVVLGINDAVVAATPDGILVSDKEASSKLKNYVISDKPMYERLPWGEYRVLERTTQPDGKNSITKSLTLDKGKHISYHFHRHRAEILTFTQGEGFAVIDGELRAVKSGDSIVISKEVKHTVSAISSLRFIEIEIGDELNEEDVSRCDYDWTNFEE